MNQVLDLAGSFLYVAVRIIAFPVFMLFDLVMGGWLLAKWAGRQSKKLQVRLQHRQQHYQLGVKKSMVFLRAKLNNTAANTH